MGGEKGEKMSVWDAEDPPCAALIGRSYEAAAALWTRGAANQEKGWDLQRAGEERGGSAPRRSGCLRLPGWREAPPLLRGALLWNVYIRAAAAAAAFANPRSARAAWLACKRRKASSPVQPRWGRGGEERRQKHRTTTRKSQGLQMPGALGCKAHTHTHKTHKTSPLMLLQLHLPPPSPARETHAAQPLPFPEVWGRRQQVSLRALQSRGTHSKMHPPPHQNLGPSHFLQKIK